MKRGRKSSWDTKIKPRLEEIESWARDGLTDDQMAELLGIGRTTFYKFKAEKADLANALKINKEIADLRVENSLYQRAIGLEVTEIIEDSVYMVGEDGRARPVGRVKRRKIVKQLPPDTTAGIFWSKNRQPEKWRDSKNIEVCGRGDKAPAISINWIKSNDD